jgi:hypothetical protein
MELIVLQCFMTCDTHLDMFDSLASINSIYLLITVHCSVIMRDELCIFGSTYICEQFFRKVKVVKRKQTNPLEDEGSCFQVASSHI